MTYPVSASCISKLHPKQDSCLILKYLDLNLKTTYLTFKYNFSNLPGIFGILMTKGGLGVVLVSPVKVNSHSSPLHVTLSLGIFHMKWNVPSLVGGLVG